jgi:hypothetical protein
MCEILMQLNRLNLFITFLCDKALIFVSEAIETIKPGQTLMLLLPF